MNFLQLAQRVRMELGASGGGPASVTSSVGYSADIVTWTKQAYREIALAYDDWDFAWRQAQVDLSEGKASFDVFNDWALRVRRIDFETMRAYYIDQPDRPVRELTWEAFKAMAANQGSGLPAWCARTPDGRTHFSPTPDAKVRATFEYYAEVPDLAQNGDVPLLDERMHMAIVWRAVMFGCSREENPALFNVAQHNYAEVMSLAALRHLPAMEAAEPLV